ncbi:serine/threonine-protein phosphatase 2A regulatory subunit B'' subunit beta-like isoform X2 [Ptychodera flava]|uniref:serine/threonine-protein phosphatase 2A regulatory subunit B'' subunit beta-like isoform X2 n=1 Tax=Ptychodera flava TaxID=63121 RepID=UPI003969C480
MKDLCHASHRRVICKVTVYHSIRVDQRHQRAVHNCYHCCRQQGKSKDGESPSPPNCSAIHYSFCTVVTLPPNLLLDNFNLNHNSRFFKVKNKNKDNSTKSTKEEVSPKPKQPNRTQETVNIPRFYYPLGKPVSQHDIDAMLQRVQDVFSQVSGGKILKNQMEKVTKACGCPLYWKAPLFKAAGGDNAGHITQNSFTSMWKKIVQNCHDEVSRFLRLLAPAGCNFLQPEDFYCLVQDVVDTHPGLQFLQDSPEFHSRYIHTVIARIFYTVNRSWTGRITLNELRRSNLLQTIQVLEDEEDINQITDYFSYEHFYVIYCKFWELDTDHDLFIDKKDLTKHNDHAISSRMIERIFSGAVTRGSTQQEGKMSYSEFVWFLMSEEDKRQPTSIEYWFRCMDLDGDGFLSMYELEYFYEEQLQKMETLGIETLPFEDCLCQMLDMVKPRHSDKISLGDLKACEMTPIFFDTFFNLEKYLDHEQRDPFASARDHDYDGPEPSDWEKYAAEEYELLVAEEGANEPELDYPDDFEPEDEEDELAAVDSAQKLTLKDPPEKAKSNSNKRSLENASSI